MGNDHGHAHDRLDVGGRTALADRSFGTTKWRVDRWDEEQTKWAIRQLGIIVPASPGGVHGVTVDAVVFHKLKVKPYSTTFVDGNLITNAGWTRLMNLLTNQGGTQALTATAVRLGVGDSNTTETYTDTALNATTNKLYQPVSGAGSLGTRTLAFSATFGTADANWAWNEFGLDVGTPTVTASTTVNALFFNHKAGIAQGTKASGQTWTATATLTFT